MELTQTKGFGVGIFLRNVIYEWGVFTTTYRPKSQVDGRGGEKETLTQKRNHPNKNFISYQRIRRIHFHLNETIM